jgi:peroxin-4
MENPNEDSPLNCDAANLIRLKEHETYKHMAKMYAKEHAIARKSYEQRVREL